MTMLLLLATLAGRPGFAERAIDDASRMLPCVVYDVRADTEDLKIVLFYDGAGQRACARGALAVTAPGSRVVFLCPRFQRQTPELRAAVIVHEVLHSKGLKEDRHHSISITEEVFRRCGR